MDIIKEDLNIQQNISCFWIKRVNGVHTILIKIPKGPSPLAPWDSISHCKICKRIKSNYSQDTLEKNKEEDLPY